MRDAEALDEVDGADIMFYHITKYDGCFWLVETRSHNVYHNSVAHHRWWSRSGR